jgi:POT family proton-dependent oligopeptide transporter
MATATVIFWLGRKKFVHIPPGGSVMLKETFSREGAKLIATLGLLFLFIAMAWALYFQTFSAWVLQADKMDRQWLSWLQPVEQWFVGVGVNFVAGWSQSEVKAAQVQAINPLLIMVMIPLFTYVVYPAVNRIVRFTALRKIATGMFFMVVAFAISGYAETLIAADPKQPPTVWWQILAFVIVTIAEIMISITCLEFSYTQAPNKMKSLIMGLFLLSYAVGNLFTAAVNWLIQNEDGSRKLPGASYYWFFTVLMFVTTLLFCVYASFYREKTYIQDDAETAAAHES